MAHISSVVGGISELTAARALMSVGYEVAWPDVAESYDIVAKDPHNKRWYTFQVKTVKVRDDRGGALVVYTRKSNGAPYPKSEVDYFLAINGDTVYMFENTEQGEVWATETSASKRWIELTAINETNEVDVV